MTACRMWAWIVIVPAAMAVPGLAGEPYPHFRPTVQEAIFRADEALTLLWSEGEFTEGPAVAPDGSVYFSDIGNRILRFDPESGEVEVYRSESGRANGLIFDRRGRLLACEGANGGNRRISRTQPDDSVRTVADSYDGKRFNSPNDLALHPDGTIYFTDPRYAGDEPRDLDFEGVFAITVDGTVTLATRDVEKPNGIVIVPDGDVAFVADNNPAGNRHLLRFDIADDRSLVNKRVLFDFGSDSRGIDGMAWGPDGHLYATAGRGEHSGIYVFGAGGEHLAFLQLPGGPTNCTFGIGSEAHTLYITAPIEPVAAGRRPPYGLLRMHNVGDKR